jgi:hypothetical protein
MKKGDFVICKKTLKIKYPKTIRTLVPYHFIRGHSYEVNYFRDYRINPLSFGGLILINKGSIIEIGWKFIIQYESNTFKKHFYSEDEIKNIKRTKIIDKMLNE